MKILALPFIIAAVSVLVDKETPVTFHTVAGNSSRYITAGNRGALDTSSNRIGQKQIFTLIDINGGEIEDGDEIRIKWNTTYWQEDKKTGLVNRCPGKEMNDACIFKIKKLDGLIALQTVSGKLVSAPTNGTALVAAGTQGESTVFEMVANSSTQ